MSRSFSIPLMVMLLLSSLGSSNFAAEVVASQRNDRPTIEVSSVEPGRVMSAQHRYGQRLPVPSIALEKRDNANFTVLMWPPSQTNQTDIKFDVLVMAKMANWTCTIALTSELDPAIGSTEIIHKEGNGTFTSAIRVAVRSEAKPNRYPIEVVANVTGGAPPCLVGETYRARAFLEVLPKPDFKIEGRPVNGEVQAGGSVSFVILVTAKGNFSEAVELSIPDPPPSIRPEFDQRKEPPPFISILSVHVDNNATPQRYELRVVGNAMSSGGHGIDITLTVMPPKPDQAVLFLLPVVVVGLLFGVFALVADMRSTVRIRQVAPSSLVLRPPRAQPAQPIPSVCPRCKHSNRKGARFCTRCGGTLSRALG